MKEVTPGVFVLKLLDKGDCQTILDAVAEQPKVRGSSGPNSMNKYGAVLHSRWLKKVMANTVKYTVAPVAKKFYGIPKLSLQPYAFTVEYDMKKQRSLAAHHDSSDVTLNVCLEKNGTGGELVFYDEKGRRPMVKLDHKPGYAVIHLGKHVHRAKPLRSGHRTNLILWCSKVKKRA